MVAADKSKIRSVDETAVGHDFVVGRPDRAAGDSCTAVQTLAMLVVADRAQHEVELDLCSLVGAGSE